MQVGFLQCLVVGDINPLFKKVKKKIIKPKKQRKREKQREKTVYHCVMLLVVVDYLYSN
jgi:hypothetical protein